MITAYHGSELGNISKFLPLTHFGTRQAAVDRMRKRDALRWFLYKCCISFQSDVYEIKDPGAVKPEGLLPGLCAARAFFPDRNEEENWKACRQVRGDAVTFRQGGDVKYAFAREKVANFLSSHDIEVIKYVNYAEDIGSTTWVIVNPDKLVTIVSVTEIHD